MYTYADYVQQTWGEADELNAVLPDETNYRLDAYGCYNNMGLWLDRSCIQFFNSTVSPSIMEFYPTVGVKRDVNSKPNADLYALRGLLSVRYTLVPTDKLEDWQEEKLSGWKPFAETTSYTVLENENWVPMGFTYDHYVTEETFENTTEKKHGNLLMKALLLTEEQIDEYGDLLTELPAADAKKDTYADYAQDCAARRAAAVSSFAATPEGFIAKTNLERENLVFFSVPYDEGFTAAVNGNAVPVEKVDNGLMAVRVPAGESEIVFTYRTPGLRTGAAISLTGAAVWVIYLALPWLRRRRNVQTSGNPVSL